MSFKDLAKADVDQVFLNLDEFAEYHNINGAIVKCIIDKDISARTTMAGIIGVFPNTVRIYVAERSIRMPKVGEHFMLDGSYHVVHQADIEKGVIVITAEWQKQ